MTKISNRLFKKGSKGMMIMTDEGDDDNDNRDLNRELKNHDEVHDDDVC